MSEHTGFAFCHDAAMYSNVLLLLMPLYLWLLMYAGAPGPSCGNEMANSRGQNGVAMKNGLP
jgi:hypothetical protein